MKHGGCFWRNENKQVLILTLKGLPSPILACIISGLALQQPPHSSSSLPSPQGHGEFSWNHKSHSYPLCRIRSDFSGPFACLTKSCINMLLQCDPSPPCSCPPLSFPQTENSFPHFWILERTIPGIMCLDYFLPSLLAHRKLMLWPPT